MDAFFAKNRLSAYLDGSLEEGEAAEVEQALAEDPALRAEYEGLRRAVKLLRDVGPVKAPPDLHSRIMARIAVEPVTVGPAAWWRRTMSRLPMEGIALAAAALVVVIAIQWKPEQAPKPPARDDVAVAVPKEAAQPAQSAPAPPTTTAPTRDLDLAKALPVGKSTPSTPKSANSDTTREPYVAEWEKDPALGAALSADSATDPTASSIVSSTAPATGTVFESSVSTEVSFRTARYYQLNTQDSQILAKLAEVAASAGGRLVTEDGQPVSTATLTDATPKARVSLVIPQGQLGQVIGELSEYGARAEPGPAAGLLYGSDSVTFDVTVFYNP